LEENRDSRNSLDHLSDFAISVGNLGVLPASRKSARCQFQRNGDFMVCQICGWRTRISDVSLPPEKHHARCGGAEARIDNERRLMRQSTLSAQFSRTSL
jgi:hypothetical protein